MNVSTVLNLWTVTCVTSGVSAETTQTWWGTLLNRYTEPQRHYHTMTHLVELTALYREVEALSLFREPKAVAWTLFFHDIIYDPKRNDNEDESAKVWSEFVATIEQEPNVTKDPQLNTTVRQYILQTKNHMAAPLDSPSDLLYFLDMDIAILGADRDRYSEYAAQIRREYQHYPQAAYVKGRTAVLKNFANHQPLFKTALFRDRLAGQSEQNLQWELTQLELPAMSDVRLYFADKDAVIRFEAEHGRRDVMRIDEDSITHILSLNAGAFAHATELRGHGGYAAILLASAAYTNTKADAILSKANATNQGVVTGEVAVPLGLADPYSVRSAADAEVGGDHVFIHTITVARQFRRRGIATKLLSDYVELIGKEFPHVRWIHALVPDAFTGPFSRLGFATVRSGEIEMFSPPLRSTASPSSKSTADDSAVPSPPSPSSPSSHRRGHPGPIIHVTTVFYEMVLVMRPQGQ